MKESFLRAAAWLANSRKRDYRDNSFCNVDGQVRSFIVAAIVVGLLGVYSWRSPDYHWLGVVSGAASVVFVLMLFAAFVDSRLQWSMYSRTLIDGYSYVLYYGSRQFTVIPK